VTPNPAVLSTQPSQLCDYCHKKPKYSNHLYCSKTCAGQAATLAATMCNHCHKKPKFQNFEYCGKKCAALAPAKPVNTGVTVSGPQANGGPSKPKGNSASTQQQQQQQQQGTQAFDPIQIAKLVAQHIPQVQAMLAPASNQSAGTVLGVLAPHVLPAVTQSNNPFADPNNQVAYQVPQQNAMTNAPNRLPMILNAISLAAGKLSTLTHKG